MAATQLRDILIPDQISPRGRGSVGWYSLPGVFFDLGPKLYLGVAGHELDDGSEVFRITLVGETDAPKVFDDSAWTRAALSVTAIPLPQDLGLGALLRFKPSVYLIRNRSTLTARLAGVSLRADVQRDCALLLTTTKSTAVLFAVDDELPYSLRATASMEHIASILDDPCTEVFLF